MEDFVMTADSRETDTEIMKAIFKIDSKNPERVWSDPTQSEFFAIWGIVTKNGLIPSTDFCWGDEGDTWFNNYVWSLNGYGIEQEVV